MNSARTARPRPGRLPLAGLLALPLAAASHVAPAQAPTAETAVLGEVEILGSRLKRIDAETPQPVVRLTFEDFQSTGFSTVGDAVRAMPIMSGQSLVSIDGGTSFTPGVSSFNLRGLGNNNTLVLINGRRAAPYASAGFNGFQTVFDLNSLPVAAIDSIEVLKDGASAIYGSDAVAGVVNVTLRRNFTGLTTDISFGNTFETDSFEKSAFAVFGSSDGRISLVTTFDWSERNSIAGSDLDYTDESDGSPYGGFNQGSTRTPIGNVRGLNDRTTFPNGQATFATPQSNPTLAAAIPGNSIWNFQEEAGFTPETRQYGFYTRGTYDFSDLLSGFVEVSYRRSETVITAASTPYATIDEKGDAPSGAGLFPASNPFNPFGQDILDLRWRITELGPRIKDVVSDTPRIVAGLTGPLPALEGWEWEAAALYTRNDTSTLERNYTSDRLVQDALNGVVIGGQTLYANPFGPNDPRVIDYLRISNPNEDTFEIRSYDADLSGPLLELPGGPLGLAVGAEYRTEKLENTGTALNRQGQIVGGGEGSDTFGSRNVTAIYAELAIPVAKGLEFQVAGRFEEYSDFGDTTKPKVAGVWRPLPEVLVRGSFSQAFLAPNLPYLYTTQSTSFTSNTLADPLRPNDARTQIRQIGGGNPDLQPEETDVTYAGVVLQPFARQRDSLFRELSLGVEFFQFEQTNLINRLTAAQILGDLDTYGNLVTRNQPAPGETVGTIAFVTTTWQNLSAGEYQGYDVNLRWVLPEFEWGQVRADLSATNVVTYELDGTEYAGEYPFPEWRGNATLAWSKGDWSASLYVTYIGSYNDDFQIQQIDEQWVFNPQVAFKGLANTTITVGVRNALDDAPPLDLSDAKLVNESTNYVEPAFWYARVTRSW